MKRPPFPTKDDFVEGYLDLLKSDHESPRHKESFWSFMMMQDLIEKFPEVVLEVVKEVLEKDDSSEVVGQVAAGPIEELLVNHGPEMIDAIEEEARNSPRFNHALGGVWKSETLPEVWSRIEAVRKATW